MISLRKYPYPYQAAFTICSDIDACSWRDFVDIHTFLNTDRSTPFGPGVSLEIGDSFWFFSDPKSPEHSFSYFDASGKTASKFAPIMRELITMGWLDTLHSYGNFTADFPFSREHARRVAKEISRHNIEIHTWVNHGDAAVNRQDFGEFYGFGDDPAKHNTYHTDILTSQGIHFFWESEKHVSPVAGQNREVSRSEAWWTTPTLQTATERVKNVAKAVNGLIKTSELLPWGREIARWQVDPVYNKVMYPFLLRDGHQLYRFHRFGHGRFDWMEDLPRFINEQTLARLIATGGASILYTHIGDRRDRSHPALSGETCRALQLLSQKSNQSQEIFITTTSRLLTYLAVSESLNYEVKEREYEIIIELSVDDPATKIMGPLNKSHLQGITFYTDDPERTTLVLRGKQIKTIINPVDESGYASISIPWKPLEALPVKHLESVE